MADDVTGGEAISGEAAQGDPGALGEGGIKALGAERKRADDAEKAVRDLRAQLDSIEDAKLTETQRLEKQLQELSAAHEAARLDAARQKVAIAEGIPAALVPYLAGSDEAALTDSARVLLAAVASAAKPGTPAPDPSQGAPGGAGGGSTASQFEAFFKNALD